MNITVVFGLHGPKKRVTWYQNIMDFPKLVKYNNQKWEWVLYDKDQNNEYVLTFSEIPTHSSNYTKDMLDFEYHFGLSIDNSCVCGAIYTSFKWDHMLFCPKWKPWNQL